LYETWERWQSTRALYLEELSLREMVVGILDAAPVSAFMDLSD